MDGLLAEIVINSENLILLAAALHHMVESLSTAVIAPEGLFDDNARTFGVFEQPGIRKSSAAAPVELW